MQQLELVCRSRSSLLWLGATTAKGMYTNLALLRQSWLTMLVNQRKVDTLETAQSTHVTRLLGIIKKFCSDASALAAKSAGRPANRLKTRAARRAPTQLDLVLSLLGGSHANNVESRDATCKAVVRLKISAYQASESWTPHFLQVCMCAFAYSKWT